MAPPTAEEEWQFVNEFFEVVDPVRLSCFESPISAWMTAPLPVVRLTLEKEDDVMVREAAVVI